MRSENEILALEVLRNEQARNRQERFFRVLCDQRRGGETLRSISEAAAIPYNTVRSYAGHNGEPCVMSYGNFLALVEAFPEYAGILHPQDGEA